MHRHLDLTNPAQPTKSKRGRKPDIPAVVDFDLGDVAGPYHDKLDEFQQEDAVRRAVARSRGERLPKGGPSPRARAAQHVLDQNRHLFRNISVPRLINRLCEYGWLRTTKIRQPPDEDGLSWSG
jgi:hypothetical protein